MNIEPAYLTNEVKGSFFRPDDYMEHVPGAHVIAKNSTPEAAKPQANKADVAAILSISKTGMSKLNARENTRENAQPVYASGDGVVSMRNVLDFGA